MNSGYSDTARRGLHVTVEYPVEDPTDSDDPTPIGFDVGESAPITGCALKRDVPRKPMVKSGSRARHLRKEMHTTLKRLREREVAEWRIDERFDHYQNALTDIVEEVSREAVEYVQQFEDPVTVLEDLSYIRERLDYGKWMNRGLHNWAFTRLQGRIEDKATESGIPVECVNAAHTSQTCHACGRLGRRDEQAEFACPHDDCHASGFQADINAAANIAGRLDPWGESVRWEPGRDDSPRDGSARDSATVHRESSEKPSQMTLAAYSDRNLPTGFPLEGKPRRLRRGGGHLPSTADAGLPNGWLRHHSVPTSRTRERVTKDALQPLLCGGRARRHQSFVGGPPIFR